MTDIVPQTTSSAAPASAAPRPAGSRQPVAPASTPKQVRARQQPAAMRFARMTGGMLVAKSVTGYAAHLRRDPFAALFADDRRDPYPLYERLRAEGDLPRSRLRLRYTTRHDLSSQILMSRAFGAAPPNGGASMTPDLDLSLLQLNAPTHTRLRRIVTPAFGRTRMQGYRQRIESVVDRLLDDVAPGEPWDLVERLAAPLPIAVITDLLGIPAYDEPAFLAYGQAIAGALDGVRSPRHAAELVRANRRLDTVFTALIEQREADPGDDVISALVTARDEGRAAPADLVPLCTLLLLAGFETTVNLIGSAVHHLLAHPDQWRMVADDPDLAENAVEETLRFASPVQLTGRFALEETEIGGHTFRPGQAVVPLIAAANRDPRVFDSPARFDITRNNAADHIAFSAGQHYCLGAPLARLEAVLTLKALARRFPTLRPAGPVTHRRGVTLHGPEHLPVTTRA